MSTMSQAETKPRVLLVDDDDEWASLVVKMLSATYSVVRASSGDKALDLTETARPDVIILDVMMPEGMNGFAVFSRLRSNPRTRNTPVIMVSQVNELTGLEFSPEVMSRDMGLAPSAFLEKPVRAGTLLKAIERALAGVS